MNGFEKRREQKKQDILFATEKLFLKSGATHLSVKEIAKAASVSPVTIFKYFDTKVNLIEEALYHYTVGLVKQIEEVVNSSIPFQEKIKKFMLLKSSMAKEYHEEVYKTYAKYVEEKNERFISIMVRNKALTNKLFEQGKKEGSINKSISDDALELYLQLLSQSIYSTDNITKVLPLIDDIMDLICYGFSGKPTEST